jgi:hypothetical protein
MALLQRIFTAARYQGLFFLGGLATAAVNFFLLITYDSTLPASQCVSSFPFVAVYATAFALGTAMFNWGFYKANN